MKAFTKALIILGTLLCSVATAYACDCLPVASTVEAVRNSTYVFAGTILEKRRFTVSDIAKDYKEFEVKIRVMRYWKGEPGKVITIRPPAESSECGFDFVQGENYIVYATGTKYPEVSACSRTVSVKSNQGQSDMKLLGDPEFP